MNYFFNSRLISIAVAIFSLYGCSNPSGTSSQRDNTLPQLDSISCADSIKDIAQSTITVKADIVYPTFYKDKQNSDGIQSLFAQHILNIQETDSIDIKKKIHQYSHDILEAYKMPPANEQIEETDKDDYSPTPRLDICQKINVAYNGNGLICFRKASEMRKNGKPTIQTNKYYTFDLDKMTRISITDLIRSEYQSEVNELLKQQLLKQEDIKSPSQLFELGYFNIENLSVTNNFYLTPKSIIFVYEPYEIACFALGETKIELNFSDIEAYLKDPNLVNNL